MLAEMLGTEYTLVAELSPGGQSPLRVTLGKFDGREPNPEVSETDTAGSNSLAGYALQVAHPVVVPDLSQEKRFVDAFLRKQGIRSAIAVPLKLQDRSFGALAACTAEGREFDDQDLLFVETVAHLVTTGIGRVQAERSLAEERRLASGVLQTIDALVLMLDKQGQILGINPACERLTGFRLEEIKGRPLWNVFSVAKEVDVCQRRLEQLRDGKSSVEYEAYLLTKHSQQRQIAWSCSAIMAGDGTVERIIATGVDITEQRQAEAKAEQAVEIANKARRAMARALVAAERRGARLSAGASGEAQAADGSQASDQSGSLPPSAQIERRRHPRRSFPYKQRIAAVLDGRLPDRETFADVQCRDIAASGFSFHSPTAPASDTLVVALGVPPKVTYLVAQVVHVTRLEKDGLKKYVIGCQYVGRAAYPEQATSTGG